MRIFFFFCSVLLFLNACNHAKVNFQPEKNAHIVIMGNTFADRMQYYGQFEAALYRNFPGHQLLIRNLGWSGDEPGLQPRPLNFGTVHQHLAHQKADIIFLCFGMNESFKGKDSINAYKSSLTKYCNDLLAEKFNGKTAPQLILVSPIAHEKVGGDYPDPTQHNIILELYTAAMKEVAGHLNIGFIDLFAPSSNAMKDTTARITMNGIHLNDEGYSLAAKWMTEALGLKYEPDTKNTLRKLVQIKNQHFFYKWRAVNGEYIYGRRKAPFGVVSYPPEMKKLDQMITSLDQVIWNTSKDPSNSEEYYKNAIAVVDESTARGSAEQAPAQHYPATTEQFTVPKGYEINLFASEKDFPVEKPVAMNFDARGRLWVAIMPTYPQYYPGFPPRDKIVILEDTDNDGRADTHTVFADSLYLPLGFLFGDNGVYVAEEPNIRFPAGY